MTRLYPTDRPRRKNAFRRGWLLLALLAALARPSADAAPPRPVVFAGSDSLFQVGEELTYNVSYSHIDIGQVRIKLVDKTVTNGRTFYKAMAYIDSYKGLPFVDLHAIYEDAFGEPVYATWFRCRLKEEERWRSYVYQFDYASKVVRIEEGIWGLPAVDKRDSLALDTLTQDGLSLFFLARQLLTCGKEVTVPVVVNEKKGNAAIDFRVEHTEEEIDAVDYPVDVLHFTGEAGFVGVLGLTGGFEGWFSHDNAHVPILAKMKVILGSVRIELMSWNRPGWTPPRAGADK
jgi:hypothetical protein